MLQHILEPCLLSALALVLSAPLKQFKRCSMIIQHLFVFVTCSALTENTTCAQERKEETLSKLTLVNKQQKMLKITWRRTISEQDSTVSEKMK